MKTAKWGRKLAALCVLGSIVAMSPQVLAQKLIKQNIQQLVEQSANIISGQVTSVTDGFDQQKRPYTEVQILVGEDVKGKLVEGDTYVFRQFGLIKPKAMGNGKVYLGMTPEGFARFAAGEQVVVFMNPELGGGLTSTVGLAQGKFVIEAGQVTNALGNEGLFDDVDTSKLSPEAANIVTHPEAMDGAAFMHLVGLMAKEQN